MRALTAFVVMAIFLASAATADGAPAGDDWSNPGKMHGTAAYDD